MHSRLVEGIHRGKTLSGHRSHSGVIKTVKAFKGCKGIKAKRLDPANLQSESGSFAELLRDFIY